LSGEPLQSPVKIDVFAHVLGLVIATQFLENAPPAELTSSLRHAAKKPKNAPELQVGPHQETFGSMHRIYGAASAPWIRHRSADPEQQLGRHQGVRIKEDQDVM